MNQERFNLPHVHERHRQPAATTHVEIRHLQVPDLIGSPHQVSVSVELQDVMGVGFLGYIPKEPYAHHILQLNAYRYLVWETYEIWNLEVAYFDMSSCRRLPVPLMDMGKVESFLVQQGSAVTEGLTGSQLPERTGEDGLWQCGYCPFTTDCWPEGMPKKVRATAKA